MFRTLRSPQFSPLLLAIAVLMLLSLVLVTPSVPVASAQDQAPPPNQPAITDQVTANSKDTCKDKKLKDLPKSKKCTHGPDPAPPGIDIAKSVAPVALASLSATPQVQCDGDGVSGFRTQVIYAHASDVPDRYNTYLASFRQWVADAERIYEESAAETGGSRYIRFVHNASCVVTVDNVVLSTAGDDTFDNTISELQALGYTRNDRKYMIFMDANVYCGIGTINGDDQPGANNVNNIGPSYGRSDAGCWDGWVVAHEHMHNLGGIQLSAPHTSGGWHCVDEYDVMCYSDTPNYPVMQYICTDSSRNSTRFDCNHDDYYHSNPPAGSYLATHWNAANSAFLVGGTPPPPCPDAAYEPDNEPVQARAFAIGGTESHAFCPGNDLDWVSFTGTAGTSYRIETLNLASNTDTVLELYSSDGVSQIGYNDDYNGWASLITFTPTASGTYYVKARQFDSAGGPGYTYDLRITSDSCKTGSTSWQNTPFASQNGDFTASFDATPNNKPMDGTIGLSAAAASSNTHLAAIVRFNNQGYIDARNGGSYAAATQIAYNPGVTYRFRLAVRISSHTYDIFVKPGSGSEQVLGLNFAFRSEQSSVTSLSNWGMYAGSGSHRVCNFAIVPVPTNLLANPGFESDSNADTRPDNWTSNSRFTRSSSSKHSGSYSGRHRATDNSGYTISQTVNNLSSGTTYNFTGWVNIPSTSDSFTFKIEVRWLNSSDSTLSTTTIKSYTTSTSGAWKQSTYSKTAPAGTVKAQVQMVVSSLNATIYADDFAFRQAVPPATANEEQEAASEAAIIDAHDPKAEVAPSDSGQSVDETMPPIEPVPADDEQTHTEMEEDVPLYQGPDD